MPDEFSYWAYAAGAAGYDWSDVTSLGSYYSYGYSLVLFPIFKLFSNPITAYRVAVGLNYVMIGIMYLLIAWIGRELCGAKMDKSLIMAAVATTYPGLIFYCNTTMVEVMLAAIYIIICILMYLYIENGRLSFLVVMSLSMVYMYFVHMRTVGIIIAGVMALLIHVFRKHGKIKPFIISLALIIALMTLGALLKSYLQKSTYSESSNLIIAVNDYSGQLWKISYIFTQNGILDFIEGLLGKVLYMGIATYGLGFFGIAYVTEKIFSDKKFSDLYIFVLLATFGELMISTLYTIIPIRVDSVIYGRYHEFTFPILIMFGIMELHKLSKYAVRTTIVAGLELIMAVSSVHCIERYDLTDFRGYFATGMSFAYMEGNFTSRGIILKALIIGIVMMYISIFIIKISKLGKSFMLFGLALAFLVCTLRVSSLYTDRFQLAAYRDISIASKIQDLIYENPDRRIVYIPSNNEQYIGILQFMMRDESIEVLTQRENLTDYTKDEIGEDDILVLYYENPYIDEAAVMYSNGLLNGHFYIYYNV
jgi:hypothetical protein